MIIAMFPPFPSLRALRFNAIFAAALLAAPVLAAHSAPLAAAPASALPAQTLLFDATGKAAGINYNARAHLRWSYEEGRYTVQQEVSMPLLGSRSQTSAGKVNATGYAPLTFSDSRKKNKGAQFDYAARQITFKNGEPPQSLQDGAQDRVSIFLQLAILMSQPDANRQSGHQFTLQTASINKTQQWTFTVGTTEILDLPIGKTRAIALMRTVEGAKNHDQGTVWLAPEHAYLPVRIKFTQDDGDYTDLKLREVQTP